MMVWDPQILRRIAVFAVVCSFCPEGLVKSHSFCVVSPLQQYFCKLCECSLNSRLFLYQPLSSLEVTWFIVISGNTSLLLVTDS